MTPLEDAVTDLAHERTTEAETLTWLTANGHAPDACTLRDAVRALRERDGLVEGALCHYTYLDCTPDPLVDLKATAITWAEENLASALRVLAGVEASAA